MTETTINGFCRQMADLWLEHFGGQSDPNNLSEPLYILALDLTDELASSQVTRLPIASIKTFLLGKTKGISTEELVNAFLTSPTNRESFELLKSVYAPQEEPTQEERIIH